MAKRKQIEAKILASGMMKKDYFVRSGIYNRICVVGKGNYLSTCGNHLQSLSTIS